MRAFEVILHERAWATLAATEATATRRLLAILEALKVAPSRKGDFQQRDAAGRINEVSLVGEWLVTHWTDHAVGQIHVVELERVED